MVDGPGGRPGGKFGGPSSGPAGRQAADRGHDSHGHLLLWLHVRARWGRQVFLSCIGRLLKLPNCSVAGWANGTEAAVSGQTSASRILASNPLCGAAGPWRGRQRAGRRVERGNSCRPPMRPELSLERAKRPPQVETGRSAIATRAIPARARRPPRTRLPHRRGGLDLALGAGASRRRAPGSQESCKARGPSSPAEATNGSETSC